MSKPNAYTERDFPLHSKESAPEASVEAMNWYEQNFGMVPNLAQVLAESPALLNAYWQSQVAISGHSALTPAETNIVQTTVAHANECQYCVAGHTAFGKTEFFNNTDEELAAIREGKPFENPKHEALRDFTLRVARNQGRMSTNQLNEFLGAGYSKAAALDVVANVAVKVMSNYANQIVLTPLDDAFAALSEGLPYKEERTAKAA